MASLCFWQEGLVPLPVSHCGIAKVFSRVKIGRVRLVNEECIGCGKCNRACDMRVDVMGNLNAHGEVCSSNCIVCLKCTDACPTDAIALSLRRHNNAQPAKAATRAERSTLKRRKLSTFDVAIAVI